jgi:hypothetical protein
MFQGMHECGDLQHIAIYDSIFHYVGEHILLIFLLKGTHFSVKKLLV